jgi:hypothetical protein
MEQLRAARLSERFAVATGDVTSGGGIATTADTGVLTGTGKTVAGINR